MAKETKQDDEDQSRKFIETARTLESDESGIAFNRAMESLSEDKKTNQKNKDQE